MSSTLSAALRSGAVTAALAGDAVLGRPVGRERMAAAGLVIAADQLGAGAVEIEDLGLRRRRSSGSMPGRASGSKPRLRTSMPTATGTVRHSPLAVDEVLEQIDGQIVDDVPAHVLERVEDGRLARAGHAGDEQQARQSARRRSAIRT